MAATLLILAAASLVWQQRDASAQSRQTTIVTVAGGGFAGSFHNQAPMVLPSIVARDPGRGFYVVDNLNQGPVIRFVNTSSNPLTSLEPDRAQ